MTQYPCVVRMFEYNQENSYHQYDLWLHSVRTVLEIPKSATDDMLYLAALLHDIGRGMQYTENVSHHEAGAELAKEILKDCCCFVFVYP